MGPVFIKHHVRHHSREKEEERREKRKTKGEAKIRFCPPQKKMKSKTKTHLSPTGRPRLLSSLVCLFPLFPFFFFRLLPMGEKYVHGCNAYKKRRCKKEKKKKNKKQSSNQGIK